LFVAAGLDCTGLAWWGETQVGDVTIRFVPSQHWSQRGVGDTNETLWGGFMIEGSSARLYHSGDTAYSMASRRSLGAAAASTLRSSLSAPTIRPGS
jgi:L-ascorbate metabolism protein UlaG (beta-lactamase superfamily)